MQTQAEIKLNPLRYHLSPEAKKRLKWMYLVRYECGNNISLAAGQTGISRTWLSQVHSRWKNNHEDPRSLEPESRAPHNTANRKLIDKRIENKIIEIRKKYQPWGKDKLAVILKRDYQLKAGASTINRYLIKNGLIGNYRKRINWPGGGKKKRTK